MNEKKQRIIDAGLNAFSDNSFSDASLNHIIEKANVSKGTFYHYFKDKMALYLDLAALCIQRKSDFVRTHPNPAYQYKQSDDFFTQLKKQTMIDIAFLKDDPLYYHFAMRLYSEPDEIKEIVRNQHGWRLDGGISDMIEIAYLKGEFNTKYPKGFIKNIVSHLTKNYEKLLFPKEHNPSPEAIEAAIDLYYDLLKHGVASK